MPCQIAPFSIVIADLPRRLGGRITEIKTLRQIAREDKLLTLFVVRASRFYIML